MSDDLLQKTQYDCDGIDPVSLFLIFSWLGAVGSVASIVSWVEQNQEMKHERWEQELNETAHYKCLQKNTEVESDMALLDAQIGKIDILLRLAQGGEVNGQPMMIPQSLHQAHFRFGGIRLNLPNELMKEFVRFHKETATICKRIDTNVISLIQELSGYKIYINTEASHRLIEFREHLNRVLRSESYLTAVEHCHQTIHLGREAMTTLKGAIYRG